jgi:hypothetical protein
MLAKSELSSYLAIQEAGSEHMSYRKSQVAGGSPCPKSKLTGAW